VKGAGHRGKREPTFHSTRHACATGLLTRGGNDHGLQHVPGHSRVETTMRYLHDDPERIRNVMQGFTCGSAPAGELHTRPAHPALATGTVGT